MAWRKRAPVIVVTGGAGVGKTSVAEVFKKLHARVVNVDRLARRLLKPGEPAWREVLKEFCGVRVRRRSPAAGRWQAADFIDRAGRPLPELPWVITPQGTVQRARLAATVFSNPAALQTLNRITHPRLRKLLTDKIRLHRRLSTRPLVLDMAVYPEKSFRGLADAVLWVRAPGGLRAKRLAGHRGLSREEAQERVRGQWKDETFAALADLTLPNLGSDRELCERARELWPKLLTLAEGGRPVR
jgi:dephospho-CoA kinase